MATITTISFAENTTYQVAASLPDAATFLFIRSSSMTAGDEDANTSHASPLRIRPASSRDTPEVSFRSTPGFFASNARFSSRIGPASESAWKTSRSAASAFATAASARQATPTRVTRRTIQCDISTGTVIDFSMTCVTPPQTSAVIRGRL